MEVPLKLQRSGMTLFGILHLPDQVETVSSAVVMVTGGPQTRVASHRLYVQVARSLISSGVAVLRFDYEGTGDSEGIWRGYKFAGSSMESAILSLREQYPNLRQIVIWSLCDGSTASAVFAARRPDLIDGLILCNPYVHSDQGKAQTLIKYYYVRRLLDKSFWQKATSLKFDLNASFRSLVDNVKQARAKSNGAEVDQSACRMEIHPDEFVRSLMTCKKSIRFILSSDDLTAQQFADLCKSHTGLRKAVQTGRITISHVRGADHTFTTHRSKQELIQVTKHALHGVLSETVKKVAANA
jgi:exosortase A-associated hydrolase 1